MSDINFDILNYIDLRGIEVKEIFETILNEKEIEENLLIKYYVLTEEIPNYFKNALRLLRQLKMISLIINENKIYKSIVEFPELSFELNFIHHLSKLEEKFKIPHDIYNRLMQQDIIFIEQSKFLPWCVENFGKRYNMTENSANFWVNLMSNLGFVQKLKFDRSNFIYILPDKDHFLDLFNYYCQKEKHDTDISIRDFGKYISKNFFEVFVNESVLSTCFQEWLIYMNVLKKVELISLSDATNFKVNKRSFSFIKII